MAIFFFFLVFSALAEIFLCVQGEVVAFVVQIYFPISENGFVEAKSEEVVKSRW